MLNHEKGLLIKDVNKLKEIENVEKALATLDTAYFKFDVSNKRYKLSIDADFKRNSDNILDISPEIRLKLTQAGHQLFEKMKEITNKNPDISYLLIIEGNTQRSNDNWNRNPDGGYELSYRRALALFNYWKNEGIKFREIGNQSEVIIAGSGYFGYSRDLNNESNNRRFSIQITSKVGQFLDIEK